VTDAKSTPAIGSHFLLRRLHSLCGLVPVGVFLCFHLFTNFQMLVGDIQHEVEFIHNMPALFFVELALWLSIGFHAALGFYYTFAGARQNVTGLSRTWTTGGTRCSASPASSPSCSSSCTWPTSAGASRRSARAHGLLRQGGRREPLATEPSPRHIADTSAQRSSTSSGRSRGLPLRQRPVDDGDHLGPGRQRSVPSADGARLVRAWAWCWRFSPSVPLGALDG
jgi:succinate dehydrogenase/fumarate reductase cytochrome b subunit